jgi:hypothetical protein
MSAKVPAVAGNAVDKLGSNGGGVLARTQAPVGAPRTKLPSTDHRERLERLRDRLETAMDDAGTRDLAPLAGRYQAVLTELASLPVIEESDGIDDLSAARRRRRAGASAS